LLDDTQTSDSSPDILFPDWNLGTSQPSVLRDPAPPLLRAAQAWLSFGANLLGLVTHLTRNRQLLTRNPKRPLFTARDPEYIFIIHSFPDSYRPGLPAMRLTLNVSYEI